MTEIDIITTTYRNPQKLKICLERVIENTKYVDFKWYLMANDPNDEVKNIIHDAIFLESYPYTDRIIPYYSDSNDGSFSSNNNELAAEGDSRYILLLNDDVEPLVGNWLLNMKQILDSDPKVGAVGSLLLYPDRKTIQHCGVVIGKRTNDLPFHIYYRKLVSNYIKPNRYYQAVTGACMLVRREDFETLGGLDTRYFYGYEDTSYCLELQHKLKKRSVYCGQSILVHHEGVSGSFKDHPKLQENIKVFRGYSAGKFYDDWNFYLSNPNFMIYGK